MRMIIAGGRDFTDTDSAADYLIKLVEENKIPDTPTIISGGARGADKVGENLAKMFDLPLEIYPADWNTYGKSAGYRRNTQMADTADVLVAFWDKSSKGTEHMIKCMQSLGKPVHILYY